MQLIVLSATAATVEAAKTSLVFIFSIPAIGIALSIACWIIGELLSKSCPPLSIGWGPEMRVYGYDRKTDLN